MIPFSRNDSVYFGAQYRLSLRAFQRHQGEEAVVGQTCVEPPTDSAVLLVVALLPGTNTWGCPRGLCGSFLLKF